MPATDLSQPLTLNEGVFLVPVTELSDEVRRKLAGEEGDVALTRPQGRSGSKLVDRDTADLLERFREPRTLAEAVLLYSRTRGAEPGEVLEEAFPLVRSLLSTGYLVALGDGAAVPAAGGALDARWHPGGELLGGRVERVLQVLEDSELYLLRRGPDRFRVLKVARPQNGAVTPFARANFAREAEVLEAVGGAPAPQLHARGELDGCPWLEMEHVAGVDPDAELATDAGRGERLRLALAVADAYARLHARGVVHGDVHPRNLLVQRDGVVRLIDFGLARCPDGPEPGPRGGIPFFFEPELARAYLEGAEPPAATPAGEQHAVAALAYRVLCGAHPRDYSLGREEMLREIAELPPLPFTARGAREWPAVEAVLARALAKDPADRYPSVAAFAAALREAADEPEGGDGAGPEAAPAAELVRHCRAAAGPGGEWLSADALPAPSASVNYGAAGLALGLLHLARARGDGEALALADLWLDRARRAAGDDSGFYEPEIEISRDTVGESSPYHGAGGIHAVAALLARARGDGAARERATEAFVQACGTPPKGLDLTLGRASHLLAAALLLDATPPGADDAALRGLGGRALAEIWQRLDAEPEMERSGIDYLGIAHGWAGLLYATLAWCATSGTAVPAGVEARCHELADLASPDGRGLTWPWTLHGQGRHSTMPGWCNGSSGYVFLWTLAHRWSGEDRFLRLAEGAAWDVFDAPDGAVSLCCGLAGRGYALLALARHTGDEAWLRRARGLAARGAGRGPAEPERAHCLVKGDFGLAVLAADLERPEGARMPLFEPAGYRDPAF